MLVDKNSGGTSLFPRMPRACFEALRLNFRIDWIDRLLATVRRRTSGGTDRCYAPSICTRHKWKNCLFHQ